MSTPSIKHDLQIKFGSMYGDEERQAVMDVIDAGAPTSGRWSEQFERDFAAYCGSRYARVVSNGTAALQLSFVALGVGPGDVVLTSPLTWIATAAAAEVLGARADFVDIDPETYNISVEQLRRKLVDHSNVKAVVPIHLYGQCAEMDDIMELGEQHGFSVVEDACHAPGALYKGKKAGTFGATGCFSFHEQKNMSTLGEGGMIVTDDPALYERICLYRSHCTRVYGASTKYCSIDENQHPMGKRFWYQDFDDCGYNFRMADVQAAVGIEQLKKLDSFTETRIKNAAYLTEGLSTVPGLRLPVTRPYNKNVFHLYPVQIDPDVFGDKETFMHTMLFEKGIKLGTHYIPIHLSTAFRNRGFKRGDYPISEQIMERLVTLPVNPRQSTEALDYLVTAIAEAAHP